MILQDAYIGLWSLDLRMATMCDLASLNTITCALGTILAEGAYMIYQKYSIGFKCAWILFWSGRS